MTDAGTATDQKSVRAAVEELLDALGAASRATERREGEASEHATAQWSDVLRENDVAAREEQEQLRGITDAGEREQAYQAGLATRREKAREMAEREIAIRYELDDVLEDAQRAEDEAIREAWVAFAADVGRALLAASAEVRTDRDVRELRQQMQYLVSVVG